MKNINREAPHYENFLQLPFSLSLVCACILYITIFTSNFSLCSSRHITHEILQPDRTTLKIVISCVLVFTCLDIRRGQE